jgi:cellulose synthase operon protein YhjQ
MKVVAVVGVMGGAGGTTVAANLGAALVARNRRALCFDFCPDNLLRLHLGLPLNESAGLAPSLLCGQAWQGNTFRGAANVDFVPFGQVAEEGDLESLASMLKAQPGWFRSQMAALQVEPDTIVICDCPRAHPALRDQVLRVADLVLLVCSPDPVSYAFATKMLANGSSASTPPTMIVLNGFDSSRRLDRDVAVLLRTGFKKNFSPVLIHRDEFVREALACKQTVLEFASSSQAAYDFGALATWVAARLGHAEPHRAA